MRARNIKPGIFKNEILGTADPLLTLLFEGLWTLADREGRLEDRPLRIKAEIFPYRDGLDIKAMIAWLEQESFISRYQVDDKDYIQITNWHKHQAPHHMEVASAIPSPVGIENKYNHAPITKKQRERIIERDGGKCKQCGSNKNLHIDHIHPVCRGGSSDDSNLQALCSKCNTKKGGKPVHESSTNRPPGVHEPTTPTDSLIPDSLIPDSLIPDSLIPDSPQCAREKKFFELCRDCIVANFPDLETANFSLIHVWESGGYDLKRHIEPAIKSAKAKGVQPRSLSYFTPMIEQSAAQKITAKPEEKPISKALSVSELNRRNEILQKFQSGTSA